MSYDPELPDALNTVRFLIGDTNETAEMYSDEEIQAVIDGNIVGFTDGAWVPYLAAAQMLDVMAIGWVTRSHGLIEERVGKLWLKRGDSHTWIVDMAKRYREIAARLLANDINFHFKVLP